MTVWTQRELWITARFLIGCAVVLYVVHQLVAFFAALR